MSHSTLGLPQPLFAGTLVRRYKRFLADVLLDGGDEVTAHCANTGTMRTCSDPGSPVLLSRSDNPRRKLQYTLELVWAGEAWVGVNTSTPNRAVAELVERQLVPSLAGYTLIRREVPYGPSRRSRIDVHLSKPGSPSPEAFVEVKNTTLRDGEYAEFPDAVTERGRKHLEDLEGVVGDGARGVILFFVGRADCQRFRPADDIDPAYGEALRRAVAAGVEPLALGMRFDPPLIELRGALPVEL